MSGSGRRLAAAAALAAALVLGGCAAATEQAQPEPTAPSAPAAAEPGDADAALPAPPPPPVEDDASQQGALDAAKAAVTAFARPALDPGQWWAELVPLLSPAAAAAYEGTDPQAVPASAVTGPPRPTPSVSAYLSTVLVPTDAGEYAVLLVREGDGSPWLVERFTPVDAADPSEPADPSGALTPPPDVPAAPPRTQPEVQPEPAP
ncbi:hypothetical protein ACI782_02560 [Geodermatophilus sp. SYSU D00703]